VTIKSLNCERETKILFQKHIPKFPLGSDVECIVYEEGNNSGIGFQKTAMSLAFNFNIIINKMRTITPFSEN
jgi:hypothetical protein